MSRTTELTSAVAATAMFLAIAGASAGSAFAQDSDVPFAKSGFSLTLVEPLPDDAVPDEADGDEINEEVADAELSRPDAASLTDLVRGMAPPTRLPEELKCLASAVYFESRGEPLAGQLAVAQVIVNRAQSGRFPGSYCAVVKQPRQFSFVRAGALPSPNKATQAWHNAKAIALIADEGWWDSPVKDALFFHATHVQPRWNLQRLARVSSHIFYR